MNDSMLDQFRNDMPTDGEDVVYYAAYGSNLMGGSFMDYMNVGRDYSERLTSQQFESYGTTLPHNVYYADINEGYGVAFLAVDTPGEAVGRIWKISRRQFTSLALLESRSDRYYDLDWDGILARRDTIVNNECTYGRVTNLGTVDGLPVLTITSPLSYEEMVKREMLLSPDYTYSLTIKMGVVESRMLVQKEIKTSLGD